MFHLDLPLAEKVLRAFFIYAFLAVGLRLAGKRELAQLNTLDFIVLLAVANAVQNGIIGQDNSVTGGLIGAATLFVVNGAVAFLLFRSLRLRKIVEGSSTLLIDNGQVVEKALRQERITMDELLVAIERQGAHDPGEVDKAILEPGGSIVTIMKTPDYETEHFMALTRQIDELKAMVAERQRPPG